MTRVIPTTPTIELSSDEEERVLRTCCRVFVGKLKARRGRRTFGGVVGVQHRLEVVGGQTETRGDQDGTTVGAFPGRHVPGLRKRGDTSLVAVTSSNSPSPADP